MNSVFSISSPLNPLLILLSAPYSSPVKDVYTSVFGANFRELPQNRRGLFRARRKVAISCARVSKFDGRREGWQRSCFINSLSGEVECEVKYFLLLFSCFVWAHDAEVSVTLTPAGSFTGKAKAISINGEIQEKKGILIMKNVALDLRDLSTGVELRDKHMKDRYLEVQKFPKAILTAAKGSDGKFSGFLVLRDIKKLIHGTYKKSGRDLITSFKIKSSDFKIKQAAYLGVGVEDEVEVKIVLEKTL